MLQRHPVKGIQEALRYASDLFGGGLNLALYKFDKAFEESGILGIRSRPSECVELVLEEPFSGGHIDGCGCCVRIVVFGGVGFDLAELVEEGCH